MTIERELVPTHGGEGLCTLPASVSGGGRGSVYVLADSEQRGLDPTGPLAQSVESIPMLPSIPVVLRSRDSLKAIFLSDLMPGGLFIAGSRGLPVGQAVTIDIAFAAEQLSCFALGYVKWKRYRGQVGLPAGIGIGFAGDAADVALQLRAMCRGESARGFVARARRFRVRIDAHVQLEQDLVAGVVTDISRTGVFLETSRTSPPATKLELRLILPRHAPVAVQVQVARRDTRGMGLRFCGGGAAALEELRELHACIQDRATRLGLAGDASPAVGIAAAR